MAVRTASHICAIFCLLIVSALSAWTQQKPTPLVPEASAQDGGTLKFVVIVSRHGVRSPTGKTDTLNQYSKQPWPAWPVPPGYLTAHGFQLMKLFGAYDRELLAAQNLLSKDGCEAAAHMRIYADSDQRTRETGKALAEGLAPGCSIPIVALPEGTPDPLFHPIEAGVGNPDRTAATAEVSARIGGDPATLAIKYKPQLGLLDNVLKGCLPPSHCAASELSAPKSILDTSSALSPGRFDHLVELRSPLGIAATMAENFLLEYSEGMKTSDVGWGQVDAATLRTLLELHTASQDIMQRTPSIARAQSSNMLFHVFASMRQAVSGQNVPGALTRVDDKLLVLAGHDTNLANIAGALGFSWDEDGRRNDTPPGGALVFELWSLNNTKDYFVRVLYTAQTLDQMRSSIRLSLANPPARVNVEVPACNSLNGICSWMAFDAIGKRVIDPAFVVEK